MAMAMGRARFAQRTTSPRFRTQLNANSLAQFVDPLPIPEIAKSSGHTAQPGQTRPSSFRTIASRCGSLKAKVHRDLKPTRLWGYSGSFSGADV